jgi:hypothetical protein
MTTHTMGAVRLTATVAAVGLVIASAGFGAVYAYTIGIQHGILLAGLTVLFAIALELIKPLALHGAFESLRTWRTWPRAVALSILGIVAVVYSLQAELALTASSRGDLTAKREHASKATNRAEDRHRRAKAELATLKPSRPVAELQALVDNGRPVCRVEVQGPSRQTVCAKPSHLVAELGRAKRKAELEGILDKADTALATGTTVGTADPGTAAIKTYLASVGVVVAAETLGQWLNLVPVLALEFGSALSMVLLSALQPRIREPLIQVVDPPVVLTGPAAGPQPLRLLPDHSQHKEAVARRLLDYLRDHGGSVAGDERGIATLIGTSKSTLHRVSRGLAETNLITICTSREGTILKLNCVPV